MNRRKVLFAVIISLSFLALGAGVYWYGNFSPIPFDAAIWLQGEQAKFSSDAPRLRMADGLVKTGVLLNKTHNEVLSMLGSPTKTTKFCEYDLVYWLGAERSFISIDSEWLAVRINNAGRVSEVCIVRD